MLKTTLLAFAVTLVAMTPAWAVTTVSVGHYVFARNSGLHTISVIATSDSGEQLQGIDLYLVMDALGPMITNVDLIHGTVFETNNVGQFDYAMPEHIVPTRQPSYYTTTATGEVPTGIVALVTIDTTNATAGLFTLSLDSPLFGPSAVYNDVGLPGGYSNGSIFIPIPEPTSVLLALFGVTGLGAVAIRRRRRRANRK